MKVVVGVDLGYGYTKVASRVNGEEFIQFPSVFERGAAVTEWLFPAEFLKSYLPLSERYYLRSGGSIIYFGELALGKAGTRDLSLRARSIENDEILIQAALALTFRKQKGQQINTNLVLGFHYLADESHINKVLSHFSGKTFDVELVDSLTREVIPLHITLEKVYAQRQGLGVVWDEVVKEINETGFKGNIQLLQETVIVVDVGTRTTEFVVIDQGKIIENLCTSVDVGIFNIFSLLAINLSRKYGITVSGQDIEKTVIKEGRNTIILDEEEIDVSEELEELKRKTWERIKSALTSVAGNVSSRIGRRRRVIFAGGGSEFFKEKIRELAESGKTEVGTVTFAEDPLFANARGYLKYGLYKEFRKK